MNSAGIVSQLPTEENGRELVVNQSFSCPMCSQVEILRTERENWYQCGHCGYCFGIARPLIRMSGPETEPLFHVGRLL
jgi:ribosomal protein S27AE